MKIISIPFLTDGQLASFKTLINFFNQPIPFLWELIMRTAFLRLRQNLIFPLIPPPHVSSPFTHIQKFLPIDSISAWAMTSIWPFSKTSRWLSSFMEHIPALLKAFQAYDRTFWIYRSNCCFEIFWKVLKQVAIIIVKSLGLRFLKLSSEINKIVCKITVVLFFF